MRSCPLVLALVPALGGSQYIHIRLFPHLTNRDRFFETEGIAVLTMLVSRYKITVKEEPQFAGETFEERKARILSCHSVMTLTYVSSCSS